MSTGKASAIRNGCQLKSFPVSLVKELICSAGAYLVNHTSPHSQDSNTMQDDRSEGHAADARAPCHAV